MKNFFQNSPNGSDGVQDILNDVLKLVESEDYDKEKQDLENSLVPNSVGNFFNNKQDDEKQKMDDEKNVQNGVQLVKKRLNDYDANILGESSLLNFEDDDMRIEEKIKIAQSLLQNYKEKISLIDTSNNSSVKNKLVEKKENIESILINLNKELRESHSITKRISSMVNAEKISFAKKLDKYKKLYKEKVRPNDFLYKFFPQIYQSKMLKDSLKKLNKINTLVGELAQTQTPFGEGDMKYESMIAYLSSAGALHAKLKKQIGK